MAREMAQVAGIEWCTNLDQEIQERSAEVGCVELIPENFFGDLGNYSPTKLFRTLEKNNIPVIVHSIGLSIASLEPFRHDYFNRILEIIEQIPTRISFSDHLCMTEMGASEIGQLTNTIYNDDTLDSVTRKVELIQKSIDVPFALENITHSFVIPGQQFTETEFIARLQDRTGVGLLLDFNNIYTNGYNFGIDPYEWLSEIDLDLIDSIHLAGGYFDEERYLQDGHCASVPEPVWEMYEQTIRKAGRPITTIVEKTWRNEERGLQPILDDQDRAQKILNGFEFRKADLRLQVQA